MGTRAAIRQIRYTPARERERAAAENNATSGYESGYEARPTAERKQTDSDGAVAQNQQVSDRAAGRQVSESASIGGGDGNSAARRGFGAGQDGASAAAGNAVTTTTVRTPAVSETSETEAPEPPAPDEMASVHLSGAGLPPSLRGTLASLERQNERTESDGLERILDEADLANRIDHKLLVPLPASAALTVNPKLEDNHRYCRPWTARFLADLARAHEAAFHKPIQVNSAVRTVEYQKRLMRTNGNAADAEGDIVSPHLTGATIDIAKQGLSREEMNWMRRQLASLQEAGKIDVEEEFEQACFHITVYKSYVPAKAVRGTSEATTSQGAPARHKATRPGAKPAAKPDANPAGQIPADLAVGVAPAQGR